MLFENSFQYFCYLQRLRNISYFNVEYQKLFDDRLIEFNNKVDLFVIREYERLYNRLRSRRNTLRKKLELLLYTNEKPIFLTMTFKPKILNNTNSFTRKEYIKTFLKDNFSEYIANIDFGKNTHREHYHAICSSNLSIESQKYYRKKIGNINFEPIYNRDFVKLSQYIDKLVNHSFKDTTINKCIYSRKKRVML